MSPIQQAMDRIGNDRRFLIAAVGLALVITAFGVVNWLTAPAMVPAASGVALELSGQMTERLAEASIPYELGNGGSEILVSEDDLARARVALARDGLSTGNRPGLELFDQQTWGWNDFTQRVNYRRALEGELERTIGHIGGVERADVHIAIGERASFRRADQRGATASVVLAMRGGQPPSAEVVRGIAQLVSSSVDGLAPDQVSVHDVTGRLWSEPADGSLTAVSARQLRLQREMETYLEQKAEAIVADVVGNGNARVRVSAQLNFDRIERTTQSVDPNRQAIATEQKAEIIPGAEGGAASTNIANSYETSKSTEVFANSVGEVERLNVAVLVNEPPKEDGTPGTPRSAAEIARLESLVRSAVGLDSTRGDGITVVSAPFERPAVPEVAEETGGFLPMVERYQRPALNLLGIGAMVVIGVLTLGALRTSAPTSATAMLSAPSTANGAALAAGSDGGAMISVPAPRPQKRIEFPEADTQVRDRVVQTVEKDPDAAARLVKNWIKEG